MFIWTVYFLTSNTIRRSSKSQCLATSEKTTRSPSISNLRKRSIEVVERRKKPKKRKAKRKKMATTTMRRSEFSVWLRKSLRSMMHLFSVSNQQAQSKRLSTTRFHSTWSLNQPSDLFRRMREVDRAAVDIWMRLPKSKLPYKILT